VPERTDLAALVAGVAERFSEDLAKSGNTLRLELAPDVVGLWDPGRLDQVLTNLLSNAIKYAPGASIEVSVARRGGHAVLTVRDHGPGLPRELEGREFDRFGRASTSRSIGGLGLGLYIVKTIVTAHGGRIAAESNPGAGSRFEVELPLDAAPGASAGEATPAPPAPTRRTAGSP
jgi:signal transduction histidine kinase